MDGDNTVYMQGGADEEPKIRRNGDTKQALGKPNGKSGRWIDISFCIILAVSLCMFVFSVIFANTHLRHVASALEERSFLQGRRTAIAERSEAYAYSPYLHDFDMEMMRINPHFIAWITVSGTPIDYPVVRGYDNERYLDTSFSGEHNIFGTLFMDYRNRGDIVHNIIIYGHNARNDTKFSPLHRFLDPDFLAEHNTITLTSNGRVTEYRIFSARLTDIHDPAYHLDFSYPGAFEAFLERNNAPAFAEQILTLSTCVTRGHDDDRLIVQGLLLPIE